MTIHPHRTQTNSKDIFIPESVEDLVNISDCRKSVRERCQWEDNSNKWQRPRWHSSTWEGWRNQYSFEPSVHFFDNSERLRKNENYCQRMTRHVSRQISWYYARLEYKWRERKWIERRNSGLPRSARQNDIGFRVLRYQYLLQNRHGGRGHDATQM